MTNIKNCTVKKLISTIAFIICLFGMTSCGKSQSYIFKEGEANIALAAMPNAGENSQATTLANAVQSKQTSVKQPNVGTVKSMVNGDLMCYVKLVDENNIAHEVGAAFDICANQNTFLNQKVRVSYERVSINDCQSAEPCGRTRQESIITRMELIRDKKTSNSQTLSNGEWTITIGNTDSWSGVNGTGNVSYRGCDSKGSCINLTGGRVTCRNGICTTGWTNGDYLYSIEQPMNNPDRPTEPGASTILRVKKGSNLVLEARGFKLISP